ERVLCPDKSGKEHEHEQCQRERAYACEQIGMSEDAAGAPAQQVQPWIAVRALRGAKKHRQQQERNSDGRRGAGEVEPKWNRQIVTLAETVRAGAIREERAERRQRTLDAPKGPGLHSS